MDLTPEDSLVLGWYFGGVRGQEGRASSKRCVSQESARSKGLARLEPSEKCTLLRPLTAGRGAPRPNETPPGIEPRIPDFLSDTLG